MGFAQFPNMPGEKFYEIKEIDYTVTLANGVATVTRKEKE